MGRKFTWIQPNGECFSRLDRMLVSNNWKEVWGEVCLWALPRDVSDHCPILLRYSSSDWGPKPFQFNNYWLKNNEFKGVVARTWNENPSKRVDVSCEEAWERPTMDGIVFPTLLEEEVEQLERTFEECEVKEIIESSQINKSPGPRRF
ncbi:hypothetical protein P8452_12974 [Trifolium repens]|nr:hypothetical protein P8452_12974 [Trifolium repens]